MKNGTIVIGTRSSKLALWQADYVADCLKERYPDLRVEKKLMTTKGDKILDAPLAKLETYSRTLDGMPLPSCFVSGISWLLGQLPSRGYPELTSRLNEFLTDFNSRAITGDPKDAGMLNAMNMDAKRP